MKKYVSLASYWDDTFGETLFVLKKNVKFQEKVFVDVMLLSTLVGREENNICKFVVTSYSNGQSHNYDIRWAGGMWSRNGRYTLFAPYP